jgi:hypothetical protein
MEGRRKKEKKGCGWKFGKFGVGMRWVSRCSEARGEVRGGV